MKRRIRKNLFYFQLWNVAAGATIIICLSIYLFAFESKNKIDFSEETTYVDDRTDSSLELDRIIDSLAALKSTQKASPATMGFAEEMKAANQQSTKGKSIDLQEKRRKLEESDRRKNNYTQPLYELNDYSVPQDAIQGVISERTTNETKTQVTTTLNQTPNPAVGERAYSDYIKKNRNSITEDACINQHGKVILLFKVNENGRPVDISILRSLCQAADREAVRLLQNGPNWTVGNKNALLEVDF